jgi:glycosyltransferase involved in cell wall biosynthesis/quercetin dioxygenase-like cupin family protein
MRVAMLSPIAWRTPPRHYGPWERVVSLLTEGLVEKGVDVTLFASADSITSGALHSIVPRLYEEDKTLDPKVWECLHISELFDMADDFDLIHNHFDFFSLSYSGRIQTPVLTTIHGFSSERILPVYKKYNGKVYYASISDADRSPELTYMTTVHHGIDLESFALSESGGDNLVFFGRIHPEKGTREAIEIAQLAKRDLIIAGVIQDKEYFRNEIKPHLDGKRVKYVGSVGPEKRNELLGNGLVLLHPIHFEEPFGLSIVEANACGTPVIAFTRGSMREMIQHGVNGFLVPDVSSAVEVVGRIDEISRFDCRKIAEERFSRDRMVEDYLALYRQIVEDTKKEDHRPWGYYQVLSDLPDHKVKRIVVFPGKRLSLQRHTRRAEHWTVLNGNPLVTRDVEDIPLKPGDSIDIPRGAMHRISNPGRETVVFIEVQMGDYFGEDDIERFEDDFRRAGTNVQEIKNSLVRRFEGNPILTKDHVSYTIETVHNAAAVKAQNDYILVFRSHLRSGRSILGLARSVDGVRFSVDPQPFMVPSKTGIFAEYE